MMLQCIVWAYKVEIHKFAFKMVVIYHTCSCENEERFRCSDINLHAAWLWPHFGLHDNHLGGHHSITRGGGGGGWSF